MALAKVDNAQRDFSAGEIDISMKRNEEHEVFKKGLRQCVNFRILDSTKLSNRLGRTAKFIAGPRVDEVLMSAANVFYIVLKNAALSVYNAAGTLVFNSTKLGDGSTNIPWTTTTAKSVVFDVYQLSIYITYADGAPANVPQVLTWDGVSQTSTWTLATYTETVFGNQKRTPFYRISPPSITLLPSAVSGAGITVTASSAVFSASMVGTRLRYVGRQLLITAFTSSTVVTATVEETLFPSVTITANNPPADVRTVGSVGDVVIGSVTGAKALITSFIDARNYVVQMINGNMFQVGAGDHIIGPGGDLGTPSGLAPGTPQAVTLWDDEVMNAFRGYPVSVAVDQGRLIFSNFPSVPPGIGWSAIGLLTDLYVPPVGVAPNNAIFEIVPGKNQVLYVAAGSEGSEFVFCDNAIYGIPINAANPLSGTSGSNFQRISGDGSAAVQPRLMQSVLVYINAGGSSVCGIMTIGAYNRANESRDISEYHNHLLNGPIAIACPAADDANFPERYFYVLNSDGGVIVGKVDVENGQIKTGTLPGWVKENGNGSVKWVSARGSNVMFTTSYAPGTAAAVVIAEQRDFTQYLDAGLSYNSPPAPFVTGGKGNLFWMANGTCTVMDLGTRELGLYNIDANGFLVPQFFGGEDLTSAQLVVGQAWTATAEPFVPAPGPGQDVHQRMFRRRIIRAAAYVINSTGYLWARLFSGPLRPGGPALGDQMNTHRVLTYNQDDDATVAPPLREGTDIWRPSGRAYDPRIAIIKDTAGPLIIVEIGMETTV